MNFEKFERDDGLVTAEPQSNREQPVRFDATIADRNEDDEAEGNWEGLVGQMMDHDTGEALEFDGGSASLSRQEAIDALVESDDEFATTQLQAEAVLEYLNREQIVEIADSDSVTVVKSFESIKETGNFQMCNNWAAMFDTFINRIDTANEKVEHVKQKLDNRETETTQRDGVDKDERMERYAQKMRNLLDGRSPSELGEEDSQQFRLYRKQYEFYDSMKKSDNGPQTSGREQELAMTMDRFDVLKTQMMERRDEFRKIAMTEAVFPQDLVKLSNTYSEVMTSMGNALSPEEKMESTSDDEFAEELLGQDEEAVEQLDESAEKLNESITR